MEKYMKKLLLPLFSLMLSFNSYGEWTKTNKSLDGGSYYIDFQTVNKLDNGYVVFWSMADVDVNNNGNMSSKIYFQGDCNLSRMKILSMIQYKEPMGLGESQSASESEVELVGWEYLPPDSIGYDSLVTVCSLADQLSMNNYQSKVLELIAEYESYEWGDDDSSYSSSSNWIPPNAYAYGDSWKCNSGYERHNNGCYKEFYR